MSPFIRLLASPVWFRQAVLVFLCNMALHTADGTDPATIAADGAQHLQQGRYVEAAMAYADARRLYELAGDINGVCEMQANIFWCKKKMNIDDLAAYAKAEGRDVIAITKYIDQAAMTAEGAVAGDQAQEYFDRAREFEYANPQLALQIAMRYFEVANRFRDSDVGREAMDRCLQAQASWDAAHDMKNAAPTQEDNLLAPNDIVSEKFLLTTPATEGVNPIPTPDAERKFTAEIRKMYAFAYKGGRLEDKIALADRLWAAAELRAKDPLLHWAMYQECIRIGNETGYIWMIVKSHERLGCTFAGYDSISRLRKDLARLGTRYSAHKALVLLDNPNDPAACLSVGRQYAGRNRMASAAPLLAKSADPLMVRIGEMEMSVRPDAALYADLGEAWITAWKQDKAVSEKEPFINRARYWYLKAQANADGLLKSRVTEGLAEVSKLMPDKVDLTINLRDITVKQWENLQGPVIPVLANAVMIMTGYQVSPAQRIMLVPHPTDTYLIGYTSNGRSFGLCTCNAYGTKYEMNAFQWGSIIGKVGAGPFQATLSAIDGGPGELVLSPNAVPGFVVGDKNIQATGSGKIRVKVVTLPEEWP